MLTSIQGVYRKGKIELEQPPQHIQDETPVIVTFLTEGQRIDLRARGINKKQARQLRAQLAAFAEDWDDPEMSVYDDYDASKRQAETR